MLAEIKNQYNKALNWSEVFDDADIEAKKMIVSYLIKKVSVRRVITLILSSTLISSNLA